MNTPPPSPIRSLLWVGVISAACLLYFLSVPPMVAYSAPARLILPLDLLPTAAASDFESYHWTDTYRRPYDWLRERLHLQGLCDSYELWWLEKSQGIIYFTQIPSLRREEASVVQG